jgi:hypothetical protein
MMTIDDGFGLERDDDTRHIIDDDRDIPPKTKGKAKAFLDRAKLYYRQSFYTMIFQNSCLVHYNGC